MPEAGLKELLEAGVHFGHQTRRWNPKMRRYIFGELDGIHIIDLVFVGTKKQARGPVQEWAERCKMPYVNQRWLGGLLTNFNTISQRISRLHELTEWQHEGKLALLPTKERMGMQAELAKLEYNLGGVRDMDRLPDAVFVTDLKTEEIAVREAVRLRIPIIGLVDTNCDPTQIDYVVPGNDDAIRSCQLVIGTIGAAVEEGAGAWRLQEERRLQEEMERRKREEEERKKREEEEKARVEAEEAAKKAAEEEAAKKAAEAPPPAQPPQGQGPQAAGPVGAGDPPPPAVAKASSGEVPPTPPPAAGASESEGSADSADAQAPKEAAAPAKEGEAK
jgi:small subunit ribosomal protein S2